MFDIIWLFVGPLGGAFIGVWIAFYLNESEKCCGHEKCAKDLEYILHSTETYKKTLERIIEKLRKIEKEIEEEEKAKKQ